MKPPRPVTDDTVILVPPQDASTTPPMARAARMTPPGAAASRGSVEARSTPSRAGTTDTHAGARIGALSAAATIVVLAGAGLGAWFFMHRSGPALPSPPSIQTQATTPAQPAQTPPAAAAPDQATSPAASSPAATSPAASSPTQSPPAASSPSQSPPTQSSPTPSPPAAAVAPAPTEFPVAAASVDTIFANVPTDLSVFRLAENQNIVVLDFASLLEQGRMLDRIAALTEKQDLPRDRVLSPAEMNQAEKQDSDGTGWFYYGHDYSAAELNRFFDLATQQGVPLSPQEAKLERLLLQLHWRNAGGNGALISLPRAGANDNVDDTTRHTILTHELSHGEYFSNPAYADYVHQFWETGLTAPERQAFRDYLAREGYDRNSQEIIENETQAYLLFTREPKFFSPSDVGMTAARQAELRGIFQRDMPAGWLRDLLASLP